MEQEGAHFVEIRVRNRKLLRNLIREHKALSKTEAAKLSGLSFPTITAALKDMMSSGEVIEMEGAISNGGRPGAVYALNSAYQYAACGWFTETQLVVKLYDAYGEQREGFEWQVDETLDTKKVAKYLQQLQRSYPRLSMVVLGVPGVVWQGKIEHLPCFPKLEGMPVKQLLEEELGIEVQLENDINTIAYAQVPSYKNFAHIFLGGGCIGTGIVIDGKLVHGAHGGAGEIETVCEMKKELIVYVTQAINVIAAVLDVPTLFLSGEDAKEMDIAKLTACLQEKIPFARLPEIIVVNNEEKLYEAGLWLMVLEKWQEK